MNHTIFYFTGTGNSLKVAQDIAANQKGTSLVSIVKCIDRVSDLFPDGKVGLCIPGLLLWTSPNRSRVH